MKPADDARVIDTTGLDPDQVVDPARRRHPGPESTDDDRRRRETAGATPRRPTPTGRAREGRAPAPADRTARLALAWYRLVQLTIARRSSVARAAGCGRPAGATSPSPGGALLVSNHLSHLDVFVLGTLLPRPLNYVARSTLFVPAAGLAHPLASAASRSSATGWGRRA